MGGLEGKGKSTRLVVRFQTVPMRFKLLQTVFTHLVNPTRISQNMYKGNPIKQQRVFGKRLTGR